MTAHADRRPASLSRPPLVLAVGSSAAVAAAAVNGYDFGAPEVVAAVGVAGAIGVLSARGRAHPRPHVLGPRPDEINGEVVIGAARARSLAAHPASQSDAA